MSDYDADRVLVETLLIAKALETRQHFFVLFVVPRVYWMREWMASFFSFFCGTETRI